MTRNRVHLTFQGEQVIVSNAFMQMVLDDEQARDLYKKLSDAYGPPPAQPDVTLAPADCVRCEAKES